MPPATAASRLDGGEAIRLAARATPAGLGFYDNPRRFQLPPHLQLLDEALCAVAAGRIKRLIVEMPPRHGKSRESSELFPAWFLCRWPDRRIILASYAATLASSFGRKARDLVKAYGKALFGVEVDPDCSAADDWGIKGRTGGMVTAGVGGGITGKGADVLIIDDPVKNHEEAQSKLQRDKVWDWYTSTAYTRLEPDGAIIIIQTRWHEDDLAGRCLTLQADEEWVRIRMPAVCDDPDTDPLGRKRGEALWPRRYSAKKLAKLAKAVGSFVWQALYQQRPVAPEGNLLKRSWWQTYDDPPALLAERLGGFDQVIASWDMAFKETTDSDYVVGQVWGAKGEDRYLLAQIRDRMDLPKTLKAVEDLARLWPEARAKLVEDKANGPAVISTLKNKLTGLIEVEPQGGKIARVVAVSPTVESKHVYLPTRVHAPWIDGFIAECANFPTGTNDDQVDAMSQALLRLEKSTTPASAPSPMSSGGAAPGGRDATGRRRPKR